MTETTHVFQVFIVKYTKGDPDKIESIYVLNESNRVEDARTKLQKHWDYLGCDYEQIVAIKLLGEAI